MEITLTLSLIAFASAVWIIYRLIRRSHRKPDSISSVGYPVGYMHSDRSGRDYAAYPVRHYELPVSPWPVIREDITLTQDNDSGFVTGLVVGELISELSQPDSSTDPAPVFSGFGGGDSDGGGATSDWSSNTDNASTANGSASDSSDSSSDSSSSSTDF